MIYVKKCALPTAKLTMQHRHGRGEIYDNDITNFEIHERAFISSRSSVNKFVNLCPEVHELPSNFSRHLFQAHELVSFTLIFY